MGAGPIFVDLGLRKESGFLHVVLCFPVDRSLTFPTLSLTDVL